MPRFIKILKWFFICSATMIVLIVVALISLPYVLRHKVESEIAAIKAQGKPVCTLDLAGKVPDSENAAVIYEKAFEVVSTPAAKKDIDRPDGLLSRNAVITPSLLADTRKTVGRYHSALDIADTASSRNKCRYHTHWEDGPVGVMFSYLSALNRVNRLALLDAVLSARDGKMEDSIRSLELAYRIGESPKDEPELVCQLTRGRCIYAADSALKMMLNDGNINEAQAKRLFDRLAAVDLHPGFQRAAEGERAKGIDLLDRVRKHGLSVLEDPSDRKKTSLPATQQRLWLSQVRACADELFMIKYQNTAVANVRLPYRDVKARNLDADTDIPAYAMVSRVRCLNLKFSKTRDMRIAKINGGQILLALMAYKDRYGAYPASISELKSELGWKIPIDPFSGSDFKYSRQGRGFIFYSIGDDLSDDGGKEPIMPSTSKTQTNLGKEKKLTKSEIERAIQDMSRSMRQQASDIVWKMDH